MTTVMKIIRTTSVSVAVFGLQQNHNHRPHKQMTEFAENPTTTKTTRIQMNRIKVTEIAQLVAFHSSQSKMSFAMESKFLFNGFCFPFSFVQFISVVGISFLFSKCFTLFCCLVDSCLLGVRRTYQWNGNFRLHFNSCLVCVQVCQTGHYWCELIYASGSNIIYASYQLASGIRIYIYIYIETSKGCIVEEYGKHNR